MKRENEHQKGKRFCAPTTYRRHARHGEICRGKYSRDGSWRLSARIARHYHPCRRRLRCRFCCHCCRELVPNIHCCIVANQFRTRTTKQPFLIKMYCKECCCLFVTTRHRYRVRRPYTCTNRTSLASNRSLARVHNRSSSRKILEDRCFYSHTAQPRNKCESGKLKQ